jgi:hypothetical protein
LRVKVDLDEREDEAGHDATGGHKESMLSPSATHLSKASASGSGGIFFSIARWTLAGSQLFVIGPSKVI